MVLYRDDIEQAEDGAMLTGMDEDAGGATLGLGMDTMPNGALAWPQPEAVCAVTVKR